MILQIIPPPPPPPGGGPPGGLIVGPPNGPFAPCIQCIPIDQGALWLIIAGLTIGIYFLIKERSKNRKL